MKRQIGFTFALMANLFLLVYILIGIGSHLETFIEFWLGIMIGVLFDLTLIDIDKILKERKKDV